MNLKIMYAVLLLLTTMACSKNNMKSISSNSLSKDNSKLEVLLVGTSHWKNYKQRGADLAQFNEIDILAPKYQTQVEAIASKIAEYGPDKIFVEKYVFRQTEIDSLYNLYRTSDWGDNQRDETYQLGFRTAQKLDLEQVYCVANVHYVFPMDTVINTALKTNQAKLKDEIYQFISEEESRYNSMVASNADLLDILKYHNSKESENRNIGWYINKINKIGKEDDYAGSFLAAQMYRNNLNILGLIQRQIKKDDDKIMILMGATHIAMFKDFIQYIPEWELIDLNGVIE